MYNPGHSSVKDQRMVAYTNPLVRAPGMPPYNLRGNGYTPGGGMNNGHHHGEPLSGLANGLGGMNLHHGNAFPPAGPRSNDVPGTGSPRNFAYQSQMTPYVPHQNYMFSSSNMQNGTPAQHTQHPTNMYSPSVPPYMGQPHAGYQYGHHMMENSPMNRSSGWNSDMSSNNVPTLLTPRRESLSSNEAEYPGTPLTFGMYPNPTVIDRSPNGVFTNSVTPSPSQPPFGMAPGVQHHMSHHIHKPLPHAPSILPMHIQLKLQQEPAIPPAIPAPSSPNKPLDRALENKNGETNVYIRGLLPETTDDMLHGWGKRFGDIQSSKSIIDLKTNLCKGFGFIKYHNFDDAENCIRGFHHLGYEVSFARESFYAKLKKFSDETNTNLYVSNIPRTMNEHELGQVFDPFKVCSSRILRDANGNGRGVGFARFETRDICEQVIRQFNNAPVCKVPGGEEHLIQIRYSDTHEQKVLKQQTAAGRQFRAAEYDLGVAQARGFSGQSQISVSSNEFESFLRREQQANGANTLKAATSPEPSGWSASSRPQVPGLALNGSASGVSVPASPTRSDARPDSVAPPETPTRPASASKASISMD